MSYNLNYDVSAMMICLIAIAFTIIKKGLRRAQNKLLLCLFISCFFGALFEIAAVWGETFSDVLSPEIIVFLNAMDFFNQTMMGYVFFRYASILVGAKSHSNKHRLGYNLISVPLIVFIVMMIVNMFTHSVFYMDENFHYARGPLYPLVYAVGLFYMLGSVFLLMFKGSKIAIFKKTMAYIFVATLFTAMGVQVLIPNLFLNLFAGSLSFLGILFTVEDDDEMYHKITGCFNRSVFMKDMELIFRRNQRSYLVVIKIVNMKFLISSTGLSNVNKTLNYLGGLLMKEVGSEAVYYCENGHFVVVSYDEESRSRIVEKIGNILGKRSENEKDILEGIKVQQIELKIPEDGSDLSQVLLVIDDELSEVRTFVDFEVESEDKIINYRREMQIEEAIDRGLKRGTFEVYYQPIWNSRKNQITCGEALLRLNDPQLGAIDPEEFIPIAEKKGYIRELGDYVFENICRFIKDHDIKEAGLHYICLNISAFQIIDIELLNRFLEIMDRYELNGSLFNLEISESSVLNSTTRLKRVLAEFIKRGFRISLDDYGTGYTNFLYLSELKFMFVKLDKSLLWKATKNTRAYVVLKDAIRLIHDLDMKVVVEGVETSAQKNMLQNLECDYFQGFYYLDAVPGEEFYRYTRGFNNR